MTISKTEPLLLDVRDLAAQLSVSAATIYRWDAEGVLPAAIRVSAGTTRWSRTTILRWLEACEQAGRCLYRNEWEAFAASRTLTPLQRKALIGARYNAEKRAPGRPRKI